MGLPRGRRHIRSCAAIVACVTLASTIAACGGDQAGPRVIRVPADVTTIVEAVESARSGDLVLIAPGTYNETIEVERAGITIRGEDRNSVVLDGQGKFANGIQVVADGVAVENLTITGYQQNGLIFDGGYDRPASEYPGSGDAVLKGYRASYVTSYNNGLYGIYAFAARDGVIEHSLASGHPDSGIYVGQCKPCNAVITNVIGERNAIGYYGTNASGGVYLINSEFRFNRLGITPNSQEMEELAPQAEAVVAGNWVHDNDDPDTPKIPKGYFGGGIVVGGGMKNRILRNLVEGHVGAGIQITGLNDFMPENNEVSENVVRDNGTDLVFDADPSNGHGNCFAENRFATSSPTGIEKVLPCGRLAGILPPGTFRPPAPPPGIPFSQVQKPDPQPNMPGSPTAPPRPVGPPPVVDLASITVPTGK